MAKYDNYFELCYGFNIFRTYCCQFINPMHIELYNADFLNFVEFNLTGDNDNYNRCDEESKYMDSSVFYLFQPCFEEANKTYDYFSAEPSTIPERSLFCAMNLIANLRHFESLENCR